MHIFFSSTAATKTHTKTRTTDTGALQRENFLIQKTVAAAKIIKPLKWDVINEGPSSQRKSFWRYTCICTLLINHKESSRLSLPFTNWEGTAKELWNEKSCFSSSEHDKKHALKLFFYFAFEQVKKRGREMGKTKLFQFFFFSVSELLRQKLPLFSANFLSLVDFSLKNTHTQQKLTTTTTFSIRRLAKRAERHVMFNS